jgi:hypothetical protein
MGQIGGRAFYMVALSGTLLVVCQICVVGHDNYFSPELHFSKKNLLVPFSTMSPLISSSWYFV